jgi:hydroxypyruvate reductase 1
MERVVITKELPGERYLEVLVASDLRVEICTLGSPEATILTNQQIAALIGNKCAGVIGQLTENWDDGLLSKLKSAGGKVYSNYAVGFNNVDVTSATKHGIAIGNTPGVETIATAELAVALTLSSARRLVEADLFLRSGK